MSDSAQGNSRKGSLERAQETNSLSCGVSDGDTPTPDRPSRTKNSELGKGDKGDSPVTLLALQVNSPRKVSLAGGSSAEESTQQNRAHDNLRVTVTNTAHKEKSNESIKEQNKDSAKSKDFSTESKEQENADKSTTNKAQSPALESTTNKAQSPALESTTNKAQSPALESTTNKAQSPALESTTNKAQSPALETPKLRVPDSSATQGSIEQSPAVSFFIGTPLGTSASDMSPAEPSNMSTRYRPDFQTNREQWEVELSAL